MMADTDLERENARLHEFLWAVSEVCKSVADPYAKTREPSEFATKRAARALVMSILGTEGDMLVYNPPAGRSAHDMTNAELERDNDRLAVALMGSALSRPGTTTRDSI